jgi:hypothetical protein
MAGRELVYGSANALIATLIRDTGDEASGKDAALPWRVLSSPNRAGSSSRLATRFPSSQEPAPALASLTMSLDASASRVSL